MVGPMIAAWFLVSIMKVPSGADPTASDIRPLFAITAGITVISLIVVLTKLSNRKWTSSSTRGFNLFKDSKAILKGNKNAQKWLAIGALGQLPMGMVIPFWQVFAQEAKGANVVVLSGMVTAAAITSIIFGYPIGALADKIGRKKVLYIIIPLFWLSVVTLIVSPSPVFLIIAGILQGFMHIAGPLTAAIQRELVTVEFMGRWIGINRLISAIIGAIMAFVGGIIADKAGIQYVFLIFIAADVLIRMPLLISMPETLKYQASIKSEE